MGSKALVVFFMSMVVATAQTTTASLLGVVRDKTGAAIPEAQVTAQNVLTSFTRATVSDESGAYLITNLPVGEYTITAQKPGFAKFVQKGITLDVEQNARVDIALAVGDVSESVTVTAESTGVETRSTAVGELVDRTRIQELPLNGRNAMSLALVVPGVISVSAPTIVSQSRSGPTITIAGGRNTQNEFRLDGVSNKNLTQNTALNFPSPDALQEFRIMTSNYSAEYGRNAGGVVVGVTRAGSNEFHGSLWEYLRNTDLNARNFFSVSKPTLVQNQYGFTAGGPVIHNKLFVFGSYQRTDIRQTQLLATARPPTALERQGDFSASSKKPNDPITGQPFPGGVIPSSRFDPVSLNVMNKYMPPANTADGRWVDLAPSPSTDNQYLWRVDYMVNAKNTLDLRFFRDDGGTRFQSGNVAPYAPNKQTLRNDNWAFHDTHTFSPSLLNEFRLGLSRDNSLVGVTDSTQLSDLGAIYPGVITPQMPNITVSGYYSLATTDIFSEHGNVYQAGDILRWFRGKHSVSIGGEFERTEEFNRGSSGNEGSFSFDGSVTGVAFADYLIGKPVSLTQKSPYERLVKGWDWYAFVQDDIRVTPRLTVNLGLRYQYFEPYHAVYGRTNTYHAGQQSTVAPTAPLGMVFPGDAGVPPGLVPDDKNNFGPRVGLAWDPLGTGRLSIRAAYGLFYEDMRSDVWTYPAVNQPFVITDTVNTPASFANPYRGVVDPFPYIYSPATAKFSYPMSLFTVPGPTLNAPYIHQFNFTVEKTLPGGMILKAGYVGKLEHNLLQMIQKNPAVYGPGATLTNTDQRRILMPGIYSSFREVDTNSNGAYHSFESSLSRRFSHGLTFLASYTYGKLLDYYSAQNLGQTPQDPYNERADRARSDEDRNHVFSGSFVYDIPVLQGRKGWMPRAFGGWSLSGLVTKVSGLPVYVISGRDFSLTGVGFDRPNLIGDPTRSHSSTADFIQQYFNTAAFVANQPGHYGSAGRNLFSGPGASNVDLSLVKSFPIGERLGKLQFRSEFFNALNHARFGQPDGNLIDKTFGQIQTRATAHYPVRPEVSILKTRTEFVQQSIAAALLADAAAAAPPPDAGWFDRPMRWAQLNLTEDDPEKMDVAFWLDYFKRIHADGTCLTAGGVVAFYPTKIPLHRPSRWLKGHESFYPDLVAGCRKLNMIVLARTDPHATYQDVYDAHPDWIAVDASGQKRRHWEVPDMWVTCALGPYNFEFMTEVTREIVTLFPVGGIFSNRWEGSGMCYCEHCRRNFADAYHMELPHTNDPHDPARRNYIAWRQQRLFDLWRLWDDTIRRVRPDARYIANSGGGALSGLDMKKVGEMAPTLFADRQGRSGTMAPWANGKNGKEYRAVLGPKAIGGIFHVGTVAPHRWPDSVKSTAETRLWVVDGIANGLRPWFNKVSGSVHDPRGLKVIEDLYQWHYRSERYLRNVEPIARVAMVYSQQTAQFYGGTQARAKVEDYTLGMYQALIGARIPFEMVHDRLLDAEHTSRYKLLLLPNIAALSDAQCGQLRDYVKRGGSVLATYETSLYDEWGTRRSDFGLADLFGVSFQTRPDGLIENSYLRVENGHHPLLTGLEDAKVLIDGTWQLDVKPGERFESPPVTRLPRYPSLPMEKNIWPIDRTDIPGVYLRQIGDSRIVYFPWDIDRLYWEVMSEDHGLMLRNAIEWATNEAPPVKVTGQGMLDVTVWRQKDSMTVHLVNLTNPMAMRPNYQELIPSPPQAVRVSLPQGTKASRVQLLVAGASPTFQQTPGHIELTVTSIRDHEVIAIDL